MIAGGGDNAAAAVGCGVVRAGTGFVSLGTSGVVFVPSETLEIDPSGALHAFCHAVPGQYHLMGVILSAGGSLRWYRDVIAAEQAADAHGRGIDPYDELMAAAAEIAPGADGLFFLPYLAGERTPHMDPFARGGWIGLTLAHDRRHLVRALLEGVSFALKDSLILMQRLGVVARRCSTRSAAVPATRSGAACSRACSACRCSASRSRRGRRSVRRCWRRSGRACTPTSTRRSRPRCAHAGRARCARCRAAGALRRAARRVREALPDAAPDRHLARGLIASDPGARSGLCPCARVA